MSCWSSSTVSAVAASAGIRRRLGGGGPGWVSQVGRRTRSYQRLPGGADGPAGLLPSHVGRSSSAPRRCPRHSPPGPARNDRRTSVVVGPRGVGADREVAPTAELGQEGPLDVDRGTAGAVLDAGDQAPRCGGRRRGTPRRAHPDPPGAPSPRAARRWAMWWASWSRSRATAAITMAPPVGHPLEPGPDVAAELDEREVGPERGELVAPPGRAGGHGRARRQLVERVADERVAGIAPLGHGRQHQTGRGGRGQVLGRVHGEVGPLVEHGLLHLLHEHALAAERADRRVGSGVARRSAPAPARRASRGARPAATRSTCSACQRARGCPGSPGAGGRVTAARLHGRRQHRQGRSNRSRRTSAYRSPRGLPAAVLQPHRRLVQQLGDQALGDRFDRVALLVVEVVELAAVALELGLAHGLGPLVQPADERRDLAGGGQLGVAVDLVDDDAPGPRRPRPGARPRHARRRRGGRRGRAA